MIFTLQGFSHRKGIRVFQFLRIDSAFVRTSFTVDVDLSTLAEFHIPMQEAPLLCRQLLENRPESDTMRRLILTKEDMHRCAEARQAAQTRPARRLSGSPPHPDAKLTGTPALDPRKA